MCKSAFFFFGFFLPNRNPLRLLIGLSSLTHKNNIFKNCQLSMQTNIYIFIYITNIFEQPGDKKESSSFHLLMNCFKLKVLKLPNDFMVIHSKPKLEKLFLKGQEETHYSSAPTKGSRPKCMKRRKIIKK